MKDLVRKVNPSIRHYFEHRVQSTLRKLQIIHEIDNTLQTRHLSSPRFQ